MYNFQYIYFNDSAASATSNQQEVYISKWEFSHESILRYISYIQAAATQPPLWNQRVLRGTARERERAEKKKRRRRRILSPFLLSVNREMYTCTHWTLRWCLSRVSPPSPFFLGLSGSPRHRERERERKEKKRKIPPRIFTHFLSCPQHSASRSFSPRWGSLPRSLSHWWVSCARRTDGGRRGAKGARLWRQSGGRAPALLRLACYTLLPLVCVGSRLYSCVPRLCASGTEREQHIAYIHIQSRHSQGRTYIVYALWTMQPTQPHTALL